MRQRKVTQKEAERAANTPRRCAIYTRVSTDEQAALEYNSLQAQEEICKNYIAIRAADPAVARKWIHAETYADAGFSGGTLDRPALKRLIADIEAGKIDVIVSYKIDRISRSISQFYEVWNLLERHQVDFASATQEFNTATSQGKLMLNLLLSFAQYERELIGERTRDKIAAARRKGRWCGGKPLLGYDIDRERKALVVNEPEARIVRDIFGTYLREMSLLRAVRALAAKGVRTKAWITAGAVRHEARPFDKVTISNLLRNPAYVGKVRHRDKLYDGLHQAIVDAATFERVQQLLAGNCRHNASQAENVNGLSLKGLVRCAACGRAMSPNSAHGRHGRRYVYYTCQTVTREGAGKCPVGSVSATALEGMLIERLGQIVSDEAIVSKMIEKVGAEASQRLPAIRDERAKVAGELRRQRDEAKRLVDAIASGAIDARSVGDRLKEVEAAVEAGEHRAAELEREAARLERSTVGPGQIRAALARFSDLWRTLEEGERGRLARLVVSEVSYDGRDKTNGQVAWKFRPFAVAPLPPAEAEGFDVGNVRRPEPYPYQTPTESNDLELFDSSAFRSQGRELRVGRAPGVRPQPARVARELALALEIQEEIDREGLTFRDAARRHGCSRMRICRLLALARLAPDIQAQIADLTTTTALEALTVEDLRWVAETMDWGEQRNRFRQVLEYVASRPLPVESSAMANVLQGG